MSSKIEQLINDMEEYLESCKPKFMSSTEIIVNKEEFSDYLRELRMKTPEEIKRYQKLISNKEAIISDAKAKAEAMLNEAAVHTSELINEHEIMQQAYAHADEIVFAANQQAQEILNNATIEANNYRDYAVQYMEEILNHLETVIASATQEATANYGNIINSLNYYRDVIQSNRNELHAVNGNGAENAVESEQTAQSDNSNTTSQ